MSEILNPMEAEFWVGVGLLIFLGIVAFIAKAPQAIAAQLDARTASIQADLDEAARIRAEAERLLETLKIERAQADRQARDMLAAAEDQVRLFEADARAKLEESLARRQQMSERKIANAEAQAQAEVKAAAADLATRLAEQVLSSRIAASGKDPLIDKAISQISAKLQ